MSAAALMKESGEGCARVLLDFQANPDVIDDCGFTALHWATVAGNDKIAKLLIDRKADVNARAGEGDGLGDTPLHRAARMGQWGVW